MTNPIRIASIQSPLLQAQTQGPMQVLTLEEMRAVVGGPIIDNGGIIGVAATTPAKD